LFLYIYFYNRFIYSPSFSGFFFFSPSVVVLSLWTSGGFRTSQNERSFFYRQSTTISSGVAQQPRHNKEQGGGQRTMYRRFHTISLLCTTFTITFFLAPPSSLIICFGFPYYWLASFSAVVSHYIGNVNFQLIRDPFIENPTWSRGIRIYYLRRPLMADGRKQKENMEGGNSMTQVFTSEIG
jgi:hypothetical protein